jgi:hypothetical protein
MERNAKTRHAARRRPEVDDRWVTDLPNDLGCLSLCSDDQIPAVHVDEMGLVPIGRDAEHPDQPTTWHQPLGL